MLASSLFDLANCVSVSSLPPCVPVTCAMIGLNCGPAGDGCGNMLDCGTCSSPLTCGGAGPSGICGKPFTYSPAVFVRDYDASKICTASQHPVWRVYSWSAVTPGNSTIAFSVSTATTLAGLPSASLYPLQWSNPPGVPAGEMLGAQAIAQTIPLTDNASASPDATLYANMLSQNNYYLRISALLTPTSDLLSAPTLASWDMQIDCEDNQ
jgi:hypothetical protein